MIELADGSVTRMSGHGKTFPTYFDTQHPEAIRGTTRLRTIDPNLIVGWNGREARLQIWGPSIAFGGWTPICDVADDYGKPYLQQVPWELILAALLEMREGELSSDKLVRLDAERRAELDREQREMLAEGASYYQRGVSGELNGWGRNLDTISAGWHNRWV